MRNIMRTQGLIKKSGISILGGFLLASVLSNSAHATLGLPIDSVETDRQKLGAVRNESVSREAYTIEEIQSESTTVREYVSLSTGLIFGVAWNGVIPPDLTIVLGDKYFNDYQIALGAATRIRGRPSSQVRAQTVVVERSGHQRSLQGRAYDPSLIPNGVSSDDIK